MEKTDLQKGFQFFRRQAFYSAGYVMPAAKALTEARKALAALPAKEGAAGASLDAMRALQEAKGPGQEAARQAFRRASEEAAKGRAFRYSAPVWRKGSKPWPQSEKGLFFFEDAGAVFRNIQAASGVKGSRIESTGYYTDSHCEDTCAAFVFQGPTRNGAEVFFAGYQFNHGDSGGFSIDLARPFRPDLDSELRLARRQIGKEYWREEMNRPAYWREAAADSARLEAARAADSMAEAAAEEEREYQEANSAGYNWAEKKEEEAALRREALAILQERKAARSINPAAFPALCAALRGKVESILSDIAQSRIDRAELADSVYGEKGRAVFCEGAGLDSFPS